MSKEKEESRWDYEKNTTEPLSKVDSMNEEKEGEWKEVMIAEYASLEKQKADAEYILDHDPNIVALVQKRILLDEEIATLEELPHRSIQDAEQQQADIKSRLVSNWDINEDKTFKCYIGTATLRTTKSLRIRNKEKLIEFLVSIKKLPQFIKSFETAKLRKIADAGLLDTEVVFWDENTSVSITIAIKEGE